MARATGEYDAGESGLYAPTGVSMKCRFQLGAFALPMALLMVASAQTPEQRNTAALEFRLQPEAVARGVPEAFDFVLRNNTDHGVRVPMPTVECRDTYDGAILLKFDFTAPKGGPTDRKQRGCVKDRIEWPPVMDRIKGWKILHSGEALTLKEVNGGSLFYDDEKPGKYEFWAVYSPPAIDSIDQKKLRESGIDFPHTELTTPHVIFEKN